MVQRGLLARVATVVALHFCHAQAVVTKQSTDAGMLGCTMGDLLAPGRHRSLVTEERQRKELRRFREALKALHGDETIALLELTLELGGKPHG